MVSVATDQRYYHGAKAARDTVNKWAQGVLYVPCALELAPAPGDLLNEWWPQCPVAHSSCRLPPVAYGTVSPSQIQSHPFPAACYFSQIIVFPKAPAFSWHALDSRTACHFCLHPCFRLDLLRDLPVHLLGGPGYLVQTFCIKTSSRQDLDCYP